jgi:hypothetical protein
MRPRSSVRKTGDGDAMPVIGQRGSDIDLFATRMRTHVLDAIDGTGGEVEIVTVRSIAGLSVIGRPGIGDVCFHDQPG